MPGVEEMERYLGDQAHGIFRVWTTSVGEIQEILERHRVQEGVHPGPSVYVKGCAQDKMSILLGRVIGMEISLPFALVAVQDVLKKKTEKNASKNLISPVTSAKQLWLNIHIEKNRLTTVYRVITMSTPVHTPRVSYTRPPSTKTPAPLLVYSAEPACQRHQFRIFFLPQGKGSS